MEKADHLTALREATLVANDVTSPPATPAVVERVRGLRDLRIRQARVLRRFESSQRSVIPTGRRS
jgi:hypothetical protein